jgi:hypothetical protein
MTKLFNSTFEVSLRIIMLLSSIADTEMTVDRIVAYDFMSVYGRYFGLSDENLHGDNNYGFSEFSARRTAVQVALKTLVTDGLIKATRRDAGFCYEISESGRKFAKGQKTAYAAEYCHIVKAAHKKYKSKSEVELMTVISNKSTEALRR